MQQKLQHQQKQRQQLTGGIMMDGTIATMSVENQNDNQIECLLGVFHCFVRFPQCISPVL